jgi:biuret amidohydrolase
VELDPARAAVVVVDMVNWQVPKDVPEGAYWNQYFVDRCADVVVPAHQLLLPAARAAGVQVVYLRVGSSAHDFSDAIRPFREGFRMYDALVDTPACEVIPELAPEPGDITLEKHGSGGFNTSQLDACLRELGVDTVIYTGVCACCSPCRQGSTWSTRATWWRTRPRRSPMSCRPRRNWSWAR